MLKKIFDTLEDLDRPLLGPNYWIVTKIGLLLPVNKINKFLYIILHEIVTIFVITQFIELYVIRSNLDLVITNLKISMLSVVCVVKSNTFICWQKKWIDLIDYVTKTDIEERMNYQDSKSMLIIKRYTAYCRGITRFYWVLVFMTFVTVTTTPLVTYYTSSNYRENVDNNGEPFTHIFSSWMPFDKYVYPGSWITVIWHLLLCAYGAIIMMSYDMMAIVIMVFFGGKLDLLRVKCAALFNDRERARSDEESLLFLKKLHKIHYLIMHYSRLFNSMLSPVMFLYVVICSLMLCASAFQLTSAKDTTEKVLMAEYLIFGVAQLFMFCWHSNDVFYKSKYITLGIYESHWWSQNSLKQKYTLLLMGKMDKTIIFTAGPYTKLSIATFINILKGAYSYFTLLHK